MDNDLEILKTAKDEAQKKVQEDPSKQHLEAFDKASRMLAAYLSGESEPKFKNRKAAFDHLKRLGIKISNGKFYGDCKNKLCRVQSDGTILKSDLDVYVSKAGLVKPDQVAGEIEISGLNKRKLEAQILKSEKLGKLYGLKCAKESGISIKRAE